MRLKQGSHRSSRSRSPQLSDESVAQFSEPVRRFAEIDRLVRAKSLAFTLVVAGVSLFFWSYGPALIVAAWLPLVAQGCRAGIRSPRTLYRWGVTYTVLISGCVVAGALATGGMQSPLLMFSIVIGFSATNGFPHQPLWLALPSLIVLSVVGIDVLAGDAGGSLLMPASAVIVATMVPLLEKDSVLLELTYRRRAVLDPLTGCLNRSSMATRMAELGAQATRISGSVGVIAFDLDDFKSVNDRFGHATGDEALQTVAYTVRKHLRRFELFYRTGGEEFVLLLPGASLETCRVMAERLRSAVAAAPIIEDPITISVGVAWESEPESIDALLDEADSALLAAKRAGRNRVVVGA